MTTLRQHIENLDPQAWAALTKRTAECAVAAAEQLGEKPPAHAHLVALATMTEAQLIQHRQNSGVAKHKRPTARMRIIEADHQRAAAEQRAREAQQDKSDAIAEAAAARAEALESAKAADAARERARTADAESARKETQRAAERREGQAVVEQLRGQLEQVRADAAAEVAAAREQARAAQERAEQRITERTAERREAQAVVEQLRGELEQVRADAAAEVAAAREQARAAQERAEQRITERTAESAAGQRALEELRAQLDHVRADADAEVAAAREQARAAQERAEQRITERGPAVQELTIPIPPWQVRPETRHVENALTTLHQINYILEVGMAEEVEAQTPLDAQLMHDLVRTIQRQADTLLQELDNLPAKFSVDSQAQAAASYANAAASACRAFLGRISIAAQQLQHRDNSPDADVIAAVISMLTDPKIQNLFEQLFIADQRGEADPDEMNPKC